MVALHDRQASIANAGRAVPLRRTRFAFVDFVAFHYAYADSMSDVASVASWQKYSLRLHEWL